MAFHEKMTKLTVKQLLSALPFAEQVISRSFLPCSIFNKHSFCLSTLQHHTKHNCNEDYLKGYESFSFLPDTNASRFLERPTCPPPFSKPCIDALHGITRDRWGTRQLHYSAFPMQKNKDEKGKKNKMIINECNLSKIKKIIYNVT